jgi:hypothetical protein
MKNVSYKIMEPVGLDSSLPEHGEMLDERIQKIRK